MIVHWLLSLLGYEQSAGDKASFFLKRHLTESERSSIAVKSQHALKELEERYRDGGGFEPVQLLQKWFDDGTFLRARDLTSFGYLWGDILANETGGNWVVAQFDGTEYFGLNVPSTSLTIAPLAMLEKRQVQGDQIDFQVFLRNTVNAVCEAKRSPKYQRP